MFKIIRSFYPFFLRLIINYPEKAHQFFLESLSLLNQKRHTSFGNYLLSNISNSFQYNDIRLKQNLWGLDFNIPIGLAAGFDKNGLATSIWNSFGFGFIEVGAVTFHAQDGNPKPRLFRLPSDKAILNRLGANNDGAASIAERLTIESRAQTFKVPVGINLCKSKVTPLNLAVDDYLSSFHRLESCVDYFTINVSSPNTPGLRILQEKEYLENILYRLQLENKFNKPLFIKISPDLTWESIKAIIELSKTHNLSGIVATNTTIKRENLNTITLNSTGNYVEKELGGISGKPISERSTEIIRFIYKESKGTLPIIGVGGIFNTEDAWNKISAGATLLQLYTGWIYQGPWCIPEIANGLTLQLEKHKLSHISQVIGSEIPFC